MQARRAQSKRRSTQTQRLPELHDSCDAERRSELDVDKTGKCLQRDCHLTLSEEAVKPYCNKTFQENGNNVSGRVRLV